MKHLKPLFCLLAVLAIAFTLASCDGDKASETKYSVQVPQFAEGNNKDTKAGIPITGDDLNTPSTVKRFFSYRVAPPITGFKQQNIAHGGKITTSLFGNSITLTMTVSSNGNYIFEGSNDSEFIIVEVSKDNKSFNYVHALLLDVDAGPGTEDELDVVVGEGDILSNNHFDSRGTAYYLGKSGQAARYAFLLHGKNDGKMYWYCYGNNKSSVNNDSISSNFSTYTPQGYETCINVIDNVVFGDNYLDSSNKYVAKFDKDGLIFDSLNYPASADELDVTEVYGMCGMLNISIATENPDVDQAKVDITSAISANNLDFNYLYVLVSNGLGKPISGSFGSIDGFDWVSDSQERWFGPAT